MVKTALRIAMTTRLVPLRARPFGRREPFTAEAAAMPAPALSDDLKLFAGTFLAGFLFVSIFLA
jgi:hypothetical protein